MPFPNKATQFQSGQNAVENARKGGSVRSEAKSFANRVKWLKRKENISDQDMQFFIERIADPKTNSLKILADAEFILNKLKEQGKYGSAIKILDTQVNLHKAMHGDKLKVEQTNVNINVNITMDDLRKRLVEADDDTVIDVEAILKEKKGERDE